MSSIPRDSNGDPYYTENLSPSDYVWKVLDVPETAPFTSKNATIFDIVAAANTMQRSVQTREPLRVGDFWF